MKLMKSILSVVLVTASLASAGWAAGGEHAAPHRAAHDSTQARLTPEQAVIIAEVLGNGSVRKVEWKPRSAVYEVKLATEDGQRRNLRVEAYGGRLMDSSAR